MNATTYYLAADLDIQADVLFDPSDSFAKACAGGVTPTVDDNDEYVFNALEIFDIFDQVHQEHYAFFELRGVNWTTVTNEARATLTDNSTDDDLWEAMTSCLGPLEDYHSALTDPATGNRFGSKGQSIYEQLFIEWMNQDVIESLEAYVVAQFARLIQIIASYMDEGSFGGIPTSYIYGTMQQGTIGYIQFNFFSSNDGTIFEVLEDLFGTVFADCYSVIIDNRVNEGGDDRASLGVASFFMQETTHVFTKRTFMGNDEWTPTTDIFVDPYANAEVRFKGQRVVLMISQSCGSACETFAIALSQTPTYFQSIGENTAGGISYILNRRMPNNWSLRSAMKSTRVRKASCTKRWDSLPMCVRKQDSCHSRSVKTGSTSGWKKPCAWPCHPPMPRPCHQLLTPLQRLPVQLQVQATAQPTNQRLNPQPLLLRRRVLDAMCLSLPSLSLLLWYCNGIVEDCLVCVVYSYNFKCSKFLELYLPGVFLGRLVIHFCRGWKR